MGCGGSKPKAAEEAAAAEAAEKEKQADEKSVVKALDEMQKSPVAGA